MKIEDIKTILVIGAGTMGQQIGFQCAASGYDVMLHDIHDDLLERAKVRIGKLAKAYQARGRLTEKEAVGALLRLTATTDPEKAGESADFLSESVPEDPVLKGEVFSRFNGICPAHTIFTTNTSSLLPSMFADATGRPDRFAALHFHDTRHTNIVDIMPHPGTSPETMSRISAFAKSIGQVAIVLKKENSGYVFNAMLISLLESAQTLAANKVAAIEDIDRSWMGVTGMAAGPFGIMDSIGIDTAHKVTHYWAGETGKPQLSRNAAFLREYVDKGWLGVKTGRGFYTYPDPAFLSPGFIAGG